MIADEFGLPERQVILSYGSEDLLKQIIHYYLDRKEKILIPKEAWWYYKKVAYEVGGFNVEYPMFRSEEDGIATFAYDVDKMIEIYDREKPRIVLIASPNNPTGNRISKTDLHRFLDACRGALVMIDEAYWGFGSTENDYVKPFLDEFPNLVICRTFSKYYALAGCRIGFAFTGKNLEELMNYTVRYLGYNRISEKYNERGYEIVEGAKKESSIIKGSKILNNSVGLAPGFLYENDGKKIFVLPGPPKEMEPMMNDEVLPHLKEISSDILLTKIIEVTGVPEGRIDEDLKDYFNMSNPTVAPYAKEKSIHIRVAIKGEIAKREELEKQLDDLVFEIKSKYSTAIVLN